ncbi:MAG: HAMP domain-containing histidine kinase [Pseudoflavonifractor sp.]|nr:HAMP domain-containing histidine kinase [Alloprevotella sp.]MCM1116218.1 HAMP domain-containing histidine kinase [Pseudoflavonifractor sp.]
MRRFGLNWWMLLVGELVSAVVAAVAFASGRVAEAIIMVIVCGGLVCALWAMVMRLARVMAMFASALEMADSSMRFDFDGGVAALRDMSRSMNRLSERFSRNARDLETSKLYYDRILRVMTHEMRNAVTPVMSLAEDMRTHREKYDDEASAEALEVIMAQCAGIRRFIDAYYQLTHLPEPQVRMVDCKGFLERMRKLGMMTAKSMGMPEECLDVAMAEGMTMTADLDLLSQALGNIIKNALEAVKGRVSPQVRVVATRAAAGVAFTVEDNGPGFPEAADGHLSYDNLFLPFNSSKPGGSGIGLCVGRQIARLHGGDLRVLATGSNGSILLLSIPD